MTQNFQSLSTRNLKKRTLSAPTTDPPSKRRLVDAEAKVIELLDSDDDVTVPTTPSQAHIKAETPSTIPISSGSREQDIKTEQVLPVFESEKLKPQIKCASESSGLFKFKLAIDESAKDSDGRYIVTKKVKVDSIENLSEVPKRWPVPPEHTTVAYIINLNDDKRWREGTTGSKEKAFDRFLKQEVISSSYYSLLSSN